MVKWRLIEANGVLNVGVRDVSALFARVLI